jgi:hypothetical protein
MILKSSKRGAFSPLEQRDGKLCFLLLVFGFSAGCLAGSFAGSRLGLVPVLSDYRDLHAAAAQTFPLCLIRFSAFHLAAFFLGSSFLGIVFLPLLSGLRGFVLSCTAASIISVYPDNGLLMLAAALAIPALISLPCFFLIVLEAYRSSARIFHLVRGSSSPRKDHLAYRTLSCLPFLIAGALTELKLVPYLVSMLI